ncbi:uncharacterized protein LOC130672390 [Microplitis mediator]|uniref:uncharacterized protein LOC130672390 n=1 Tax=Microplitis mediator TaxID=375433 RepID=UPI002553A41B|nr:uncharacterized protein LOC130672390 [Microplitis mediator]XP_057332935.1 uncharacterized protein LOC130672390 [Microplitis mediator]
MLSVATNTPTVHHHYKSISPTAPANQNSRSPRRLLKKVSKSWKNCHKYNVFSRNKVKSVGNIIKKNSAQYIESCGKSSSSENASTSSSGIKRDLVAEVNCKDSLPDDEEFMIIDDKQTDKLITSNSDRYCKVFIETSAEVESKIAKVDNIDCKKRRRPGLGGRLAIATKLLKDNNSSAMAVKESPEENLTVNHQKAAAAVVGVVDPHQSQNNLNECENNNQNQDENWNQHEAQPEHHQFQEEVNNKDECAYDNLVQGWAEPYNDYQASEAAYYMTGFPNPPGENRCWLNATLHALFVLPLIDNIDRNLVVRLSKLTKTLVAMQCFWRQGSKNTEKTHQTVTKFKEELAILDNSYPSKNQQDVSEFLMILLNYVKSEYIDQLSAQSNEEMENVPENHQKISSKDNPRPASSPSKRQPLATLFPLKPNGNAANAIVGTRDDSIKDKDDKSPDKDDKTPDEDDKTPNNPIDECFMLPMVEHSICQNCKKHRKRNINNLMLYVDLPSNQNNNEEVTVISSDSPASPATELSSAILKSMEPEERSVTCPKCQSEKHYVSTSFRGCPNVMIVQLNRYGIFSGGLVDKINSAVNIPAELDIEINDSNATDENPSGTTTVHKFKPICIIAHVGSAMDCGHYTTYAKHDHQWFHYNDMDVTPMTETEALTAAQTTAYLIFFVNVKPPALTTSFDLNKDDLPGKLDDNPSL